MSKCEHLIRLLTTLTQNEFYISFTVSGAKVLKNCVCILSNSIALKSYRVFLKQAKNNFSDRTEIALNKEVLINSKIADTVLFFVCLTNFPPNLESLSLLRSRYLGRHATLLPHYSHCIHN